MSCGELLVATSFLFGSILYLAGDPWALEPLDPGGVDGDGEELLCRVIEEDPLRSETGEDGGGGTGAATDDDTGPS